MAMKLHTSLHPSDVQDALNRAKASGNVTPDIEFVEYGVGNSRTHSIRFDIQLGTYDKTSGPTKSRRYKNSGQYGAGSVWAATYDEWGWFMAQVFDRDPGAQFGDRKNGYNGVHDFNAKTGSKYVLSQSTL
jgi:hypothetical protein